LAGSCTAIKIKEAFRQLNEKFFEKNNAEKVKIMIGDSCSTQIAGLKRCNLVFPECNTNDMCIPSH
jgi:major membrane immunogen (membrane-anchored lipoprotein)